MTHTNGQIPDLTAGTPSLVVNAQIFHQVD